MIKSHVLYQLSYEPNGGKLRCVRDPAPPLLRCKGTSFLNIVQV